MQARLVVTFAIFLSVLLIFAAITALPASAQTESVLHSLRTIEGVSPVMGLVFDSAGNLYGAAEEGGSSNNGTVFELLPKAGGGWTEKTLFTFTGATTGSMPLASLVLDAAGNLYGTTKLGGARGAGVAFELTPSSSGRWTEKVLHTFGSGSDGAYPVGNLVFDHAGNLYGTTQGGGAHGNGQENTGGTAFKLTHKSGGTWTESVLYSFGANSTDAVTPRANLVFDTGGNLFGTTTRGGVNHVGTVFKLTPQAGGIWKETIIHSFSRDFNTGDGYTPNAGVIFDHVGNLYGTTTFGGDGGGVAFELSPAGSVWTETVLYSFPFGFGQPTNSYSNLVFDAVGNLYGTTIYGGDAEVDEGFDGTVFELKPNGNGTWTKSDLYGFDSVHGANPGIGALVVDSSGKLYGATQAGGANKNGVVFQVSP